MVYKMKVKTCLSSSFLYWEQCWWQRTFGETYALQGLTTFSILVDAALEEGLVSFISWWELMFMFWFNVHVLISFLRTTALQFCGNMLFCHATVTQQLSKGCSSARGHSLPMISLLLWPFRFYSRVCSFSTHQCPHCNLGMSSGADWIPA